MNLKEEIQDKQKATWTDVCFSWDVSHFEIKKWKKSLLLDVDHMKQRDDDKQHQSEVYDILQFLILF